jgi:hypothetical protein
MARVSGNATGVGTFVPCEGSRATEARLIMLLVNTTAISDHNEAIRVKPNDPDFYDDRQYRVKSIEVGLSC